MIVNGCIRDTFLRLRVGVPGKKDAILFRAEASECHTVTKLSQRMINGRFAGNIGNW